MKTFIFGAILVSLAALVTVVVMRLPDSAIMSLAGIFCGMSASVPVAAALLWLLVARGNTTTPETMPEPQIIIYAPTNRPTVKTVKALTEPK